MVQFFIVTCGIPKTPTTKYQQPSTCRSRLYNPLRDPEASSLCNVIAKIKLYNSAREAVGAVKVNASVLRFDKLVSGT